MHVYLCGSNLLLFRFIETSKNLSIALYTVLQWHKGLQGEKADWKRENLASNIKINWNYFSYTSTRNKTINDSLNYCIPKWLLCRTLQTQSFTASITNCNGNWMVKKRKTRNRLFCLGLWYKTPVLEKQRRKEGRLSKEYIRENKSSMIKVFNIKQILRFDPSSCERLQLVLQLNSYSTNCRCKL